MRRRLQKNHESIYCFVLKEIVDDLELKAGDFLDFTRKGKSIIAIPVAAPVRILLQAAQHQSMSKGDAHE